MTTQKILHITTFQGGGAGIAATRLHNALLKHGYESRFLFLNKGTLSATVFRYSNQIYLWELLMRILKKLGFPLTLEQKNDYSIRKYKRNVEMFSFANTPYTHLHKHRLIKEADIIHLHWISNFVDYKSFFTNIAKPIVWTLHDMNPFQGGFHYREDQKRWGDALHQLDTEQFNIKRNALQHVAANKLTVVTPSEWLLRLSEQSQLLGRFPHQHIFNGVDVSIFRCLQNKKLPAGKNKIEVLFVAESLHNYRKGFDFVLDILHNPTITNRCRFTAVGEVKTSSRIPEINYIGIIKDEKKISELYNDAHIFLLPSREDNLPNSMIESLCCGTPVVGFAVGGLCDAISNGKNGYLSEEVSSQGLSNALLTCIANIDNLDNESIAADAHLKFSTETQVKAFATVYKNCLQHQPAESVAAE